MSHAKIPLLALVLWMPLAAFAAAADLAQSPDCAAQCEQAQLPDEAADASVEDNEPFPLPAAGVVLKPDAVRLPGHDGHQPLDGHLVAPLLPPPDRATAR